MDIKINQNSESSESRSLILVTPTPKTDKNRRCNNNPDFSCVFDARYIHSVDQKKIGRLLPESSMTEGCTKFLPQYPSHIYLNDWSNDFFI